MAALDAGYDVRASGVTLDRFCGSGITAVNLAAAQIMSGMEDLVIAGGTEMMSYTAATRRPGVPRRTGPDGQRQHPPAGQAPAEPPGHLRRRHRHAGRHQPRGAGRAGPASASSAPTRRSREGRFDRALVPVYNDDGTLALDREEFPRPETTLEGLAALKPSFAAMANVPLDDAEGTTLAGLINPVYPDLKIQHFHHAGNSSGVVDGAAAVLLASPDYARQATA